MLRLMKNLTNRKDDEIVSEYVGIFYLRLTDKNRLEFLKIGYHDHNGLQSKTAGGGKEPGETREECAIREGSEETGLVPDEVYPLCTTRHLDDSGFGYHIKSFYFALLHECKGELRTERMRDGNTLLEAPVWADLKEFARAGFYSHARPARQLLEYLAVHVAA